MNSSDRTRMDVAMRETTRRVALKLAGGAALLAVAGAGPDRAALARRQVRLRRRRATMA